MERALRNIGSLARAPGQLARSQRFRRADVVRLQRSAPSLNERLHFATIHVDAGDTYRMPTNGDLPTLRPC